MEITDWILRLTVAGLVLAAIWYALRPKYVFTLSIEGKHVRSRGMVPRGFLQEAADVCREAQVGNGQIHGLRRGRAIVLAFAGPIPSDCRQRLRNLWQVHGPRM